MTTSGYATSSMRDLNFIKIYLDTAIEHYSCEYEDKI
jgi:hypothetical protein